MDGETHLNEKTPSYLCTKSTAGICSWTTSHPRTAVQECVRQKNESQGEQRTVRNPEPVQCQIQVRGVLVDVVGQVYHQHQRCTAADWTVSLTRNVHPCITLASQVQVLALQLREDLEELLEEAYDLSSDIILVLQPHTKPIPLAHTCICTPHASM